MLTTLVASFLGLAGSWIPQLFKMWSDKSDKAHEITLLQMQIDAAKEQGAEKLSEIGESGDAAAAVAVYKTYKTGISWVDAYQGLVRPTLAFAFFGRYMWITYLQYSLLPQNSASFIYSDLFWSADDKALFAAVITFYFGDRAINKRFAK